MSLIRIRVAARSYDAKRQFVPQVHWLSLSRIGRTSTSRPTSWVLCSGMLPPCSKLTSPTETRPWPVATKARAAASSWPIAAPVPQLARPLPTL